MYIRETSEVNQKSGEIYKISLKICNKFDKLFPVTSDSGHVFQYAENDSNKPYM